MPATFGICGYLIAGMGRSYRARPSLSLFPLAVKEGVIIPSD